MMMMMNAASDANLGQLSTNGDRMSRGVNAGTWSPEEDTRLRDAVAEHGSRWVLVAARVGTRNGDQCAKRWNENLNPELDHSPWSPLEDRLLMYLVDTFGNNWKSIANGFFEARAPQSLKNRHSLLMRRLKRQGGGTNSTKHQSTSLNRSGRGARTPLTPATSAVDLLTLATSAGSSSGITTPSFPVAEDGESNVTALLEQHWWRTSVEGDSARQTATDDATQQLISPTSDADGSSATFFPCSAASASTPSNALIDASEIQWTEHGAWQACLSSSTESTAEQHSTTNTNGKNTSSTSTNGSEMALDSPLLVSSRSSRSNSACPTVECTLDQQSPLLSGGVSTFTDSSSGDGSGANPAINLSLTCQRGNLRALAHHLVDAATAEMGRRSAVDEDQVTLTLRLKIG